MCPFPQNLWIVYALLGELLCPPKRSVCVYRLVLFEWLMSFTTSSGWLVHYKGVFTWELTRLRNPFVRCKNSSIGLSRGSRTRQNYAPQCSASSICTSLRKPSSSHLPVTVHKAYNRKMLDKFFRSKRHFLGKRQFLVVLGGNFFENARQLGYFWKLRVKEKESMKTYLFFVDSL